MNQLYYPNRPLAPSSAAAQAASGWLLPSGGTRGANVTGETGRLRTVVPSFSDCAWPTALFTLEVVVSIMPARGLSRSMSMAPAAKVAQASQKFAAAADDTKKKRGLSRTMTSAAIEPGSKKDDVAASGGGDGGGGGGKKKKEKVLSDTIQVGIRCRPLIGRDAGQIRAWDTQKRGLSANDKAPIPPGKEAKDKIPWMFDNVFDEESDVYQIHEAFTSGLTEACLDGFHGAPAHLAAHRAILLTRRPHAMLRQRGLPLRQSDSAAHG